MTEPRTIIIDETLEEAQERAQQNWRDYQAMCDLARRLAPVCRNCIHAGPLTASGNGSDGYASCYHDAPVPTSESHRIGHWDAGTFANPARWPAVHENQTCGAFKLRPLPKAKRDMIPLGSFVKDWAFLEDAGE